MKQITKCIEDFVVKQLNLALSHSWKWKWAFPMEIKILFILGHCQIGQKKTQYEGFGWGWGPIRAIQPAITAVTQRLWHQASRDVFPTKHILQNMRRRRQTLARTLTLVVMQQGGSRCSASHLCWCLLCSELTQVLVHLVLHWVRLYIWYCTGWDWDAFDPFLKFNQSLNYWG